MVQRPVGSVLGLQPKAGCSCGGLGSTGCWLSSVLSRGPDWLPAPQLSPSRLPVPRALLRIVPTLPGVGMSPCARTAGCNWENSLWPRNGYLWWKLDSCLAAFNTSGNTNMKEWIFIEDFCAGYELLSVKWSFLETLCYDRRGSWGCNGKTLCPIPRVTFSIWALEAMFWLCVTQSPLNRFAGCRIVIFDPLC